MHKCLGRAVIDLRAKMHWSQEDLAHELGKAAARLGDHHHHPTRIRISQWETGDAAPSAEYRVALGKIAAKHPKTQHLAEYFRAPMSAWRLVGLCKVPDEREEH